MLLLSVAFGSPLYDYVHFDDGAYSYFDTGLKLVEPGWTADTMVSSGLRDAGYELLPPLFLGGWHPTARPSQDKKRGKGPDGAQYLRGQVSSSALLSQRRQRHPTKYITIHYILHCILR